MMDGDETKPLSVITEVDVSEDLPNGDDSAFGDGHCKQEHVLVGEVDDSDRDEVDDGVNENAGAIIEPNQVFVATSQGLLSATALQSVQVNQDAASGIKTTHIVIHDQTLTVADPTDPGLKTPSTPIPPPTPASPLSRERGFRYQWDASAFEAVLPVRCKSTSGEMHKCRFGSGGRGRCILMANKWYTPSEFEAVCGRASSKDWKRSIRFGGRTLHCLIEDGILKPHATSCTCAACCDDESVTGPVRLFVPYKRRKKDSSSCELVRKKSLKSPPASEDLSNSPKEHSVVWKTIPAHSGAGDEATAAAESVVLGSAMMGQGETIQIISTDSTGNLTVEPTAVIGQLEASGATQTVKTIQPVATTSFESFEDQKMWCQLEDMTSGLVAQAQQLQAMVNQARKHSQAQHHHDLTALRAQLEKEKNEAINAVRIEAQINMSRAVIEERAQKDIAVQQALAQVRSEMQEKQAAESVAVVTDGKHTYNVTWLAPADAVQGTVQGTFLEADPSDMDTDKEKD